MGCEFQALEDAPHQAHVAEVQLGIGCQPGQAYWGLGAALQHLHKGFGLGRAGGHTGHIAVEQLYQGLRVLGLLAQEEMVPRRGITRSTILESVAVGAMSGTP